MAKEIKRFLGHGLKDGGGNEDLLCPECGGVTIKGFYSLLRFGSVSVLRWAENAFAGCHHSK